MKVAINVSQKFAVSCNRQRSHSRHGVCLVSENRNNQTAKIHLLKGGIMNVTEQTFSDGRHYAAERFEPGMPKAGPKRLARGLGWFSIGLGMTGLLEPGLIASIAGVPKARTGLIRLYGLREIASGITIFS